MCEELENSHIVTVDTIYCVTIHFISVMKPRSVIIPKTTCTHPTPAVLPRQKPTPKLQSQCTNHAFYVNTWQQKHVCDSTTYHDVFVLIIIVDFMWFGDSLWPKPAVALLLVASDQSVTSFLVHASFSPRTELYCHHGLTL